MLLHIFICFDWFISRRKLFQKSFENVFEVLEKKKEITSFSVRAKSPVSPRALFPWASRAIFSLCLTATRSHSSESSSACS
jgi:hypothetical protein